MASKDLEKVKWFEKQEFKNSSKFLSDVSFTDILKFNSQGSLFEDEDFNECDSGFCGI